MRRMFKQNLEAVEAGRDPIGVVRAVHDRIDLPCEKNKFGAGAVFPIQWINSGFSRYSPQKDDLLALHMSAATAREGTPAGG
jgi:5,5'-dehydrodivanillate O-demethylase